MGTGSRFMLRWWGAGEDCGDNILGGVLSVVGVELSESNRQTIAVKRTGGEERREERMEEGERRRYSALPSVAGSWEAAPWLPCVCDYACSSQAVRLQVLRL